MVVQSNWMTRVIIMLYHISFTFKIGQRADGGGGSVEEDAVNIFIGIVYFIIILYQYFYHFISGCHF